MRLQNYFSRKMSPTDIGILLSSFEIIYFQWLKGKVVPVLSTEQDATKAYFHSFFGLGTRGRRAVSFTPRAALHPGKEPHNIISLALLAVRMNTFFSIHQIPNSPLTNAFLVQCSSWDVWHGVKNPPKVRLQNHRRIPYFFYSIPAE
jgi:hypothetical protein